LLPEPEIPFLYSNCTEQNWECYFEPLSRCTVSDAEEILTVSGGVYGTQYLNTSHQVLRGKKVRTIDIQEIMWLISLWVKFPSCYDDETGRGSPYCQI
jgi:hypothetical protein